MKFFHWLYTSYPWPHLITNCFKLGKCAQWTVPVLRKNGMHDLCTVVYAKILTNNSDDLDPDCFNESLKITLKQSEAIHG